MDGGRRGMHRKRIMTGGLGLSVAIGIGIAAAASAHGQTHEEAKVPVDLYVMSQCPFGVNAEKVIFPSVKSLEPFVELRLHFIGTPQPSPDGDRKKTQFTSLHGASEVAENLRQLCAKRHFPNKYLDYILERNVNVHDANWQNAASKVGLDVNVIEQCSQGEEGTTLWLEDLKAVQARGASASPTIDINGSPYTGPRGLRSITLALCQALQGRGISTPEACGKAEAMPPDPVPAAGGGCGGQAAGAGGMPAGAGPTGGALAPSPLVFTIRVVADSRCPACRLSFLDSLKQFYPKAEISALDVDSKAGGALIQQVKAQHLPLYVLDKKVEETANFPRLKSLYLPMGDVYVVRPDVAEPRVHLNRTVRPHHLDLFVNSLAPVTPAVESELLQFFHDTDQADLTFSIHFVVGEAAQASAERRPDTPAGTVRAAAVNELAAVTPGPIVSAGGEAELKENLRQACLFQHASMGEFFKYLMCRSQDLNNASLGDTCLAMGDAIKTCLEGPEGQNLLRADADWSRSLGIKSGPVVLWENRYGPFGFYELDSLESLVKGKK